MKTLRITLLSLCEIIFFAVLSGQQKTCNNNFIKKNVKFAAAQESRQVKQIEKSGRFVNPRTFENGKIKYVSYKDWTAGFFPGSMWYLYELTAKKKWKNLAMRYTQQLDSTKYRTNTHDLGFILECSYGNGYRLTRDSTYKNVIIRAAQSLKTRFRPAAGIIQSWDLNPGWQSQRGWECPVIIDNMMNLEMLFNATRLSGDSSYYKIAVSHADKTMQNHYRPDYSCYHVVDYSLKDGSVRSRQTGQGYAHESSWARGQAWGIYGFTVCYRETHNPKYLLQAQKAFDFVIHAKNFPSDYVPYWDFDAPKIPNEPRDASAAAVMASALYELSTYENSKFYKSWADKIMISLGSPAYRAKLSENGNFILMHSVGSIPHGVEIDVPLNYADYYFLEALKHKKELESHK